MLVFSGGEIPAPTPPPPRHPILPHTYPPPLTRTPADALRVLADCDMRDSGPHTAIAALSAGCTPVRFSAHSHYPSHFCYRALHRAYATLAVGFKCALTALLVAIARCLLDTFHCRGPKSRRKVHSPAVIFPLFSPPVFSSAEHICLARDGGELHWTAAGLCRPLPLPDLPGRTGRRNALLWSFPMAAPAVRGDSDG